MSELKIEVFTSVTCPHCSAAIRATKELLEEQPQLKSRVKWVEVSTSTAQGQRKGKTYGIRSVPTIILTNSEGERGGLMGTPTKKRYIETVYEMLGERPPTNKGESVKKGFLSRIFRKN